MTRKERSALNKANHAASMALIKGRTTQNKTDFNRAFGFSKMSAKTELSKSLNRRTKLDGDGLVNHENLRGGRVNMGSIRAEDVELAELQAALDVTFHYNILTISDEPEQEFSALRPFRTIDPKVAAASKHREGHIIKGPLPELSEGPTKVTNTVDVSEPSDWFGTKTTAVMSVPVYLA